MKGGYYSYPPKPVREPTEAQIAIVKRLAEQLGVPIPEKNFMMGLTPGFQDMIVGTVIILGADGEEFADVPISRQQWKTILKEWGNDVD